MTDIIYDIEVYPNLFLCTTIDAINKQITTFEVSPRANDTKSFKAYIRNLSLNKNRMVGFNNFAYDYPVVHYIVTGQASSLKDVYEHSHNLIKGDKEFKFRNIIWGKNQLVQQIDLFKIHHFDNKARSTSLKVLEFNMQSQSIKDLPFDPTKKLTSHTQIDSMIEYNIHDVKETLKFYEHSKDKIKFREQISVEYGRDFMNHNDTKIGKDFFIMELENINKDICYIKSSNGRIPRQTKRESIVVKDILFDYIEFSTPEFNKVLDKFKDLTVINTKGKLDISCVLNGFQFDFGTGGIHGSVKSKAIHSTVDNVLIDLDVTSFYPSVAIENRLYPEHLGNAFVGIYSDIKERRMRYDKKSNQSAMLKLALNGVYGDTNNPYSPFYDPKYTMTVTINGQLMLCMLAERLITIEGLSIIQINTDGLTVNIPRNKLQICSRVCKEWQHITNMKLEQVVYKSMFVRDVNNYIAVYKDDSVKRKGAYEYEDLNTPTKVQWHKNHSSFVIQKAAEAYLTKGTDIAKFIVGHNNIYDFFLRTKVPRNSKLVLRNGENDTNLQNVTRYLISKEGSSLVKIMPPVLKNKKLVKLKKTEKGIEIWIPTVDGTSMRKKITVKNRDDIGIKLDQMLEHREIGISTGWLVTECNEIHNEEIEFYDINYEYYIKEANKLTENF